MKKVKFLSIVALVMVLSLSVLVTSCNQVEAFYQSLFTGGSVDDMAMKTLSSLHKQGQITDAQWASIQAADLIYYNSFQTACVMYAAYYQGPNTNAETTVSNEISALVANWTTLQALVNSIIPNFIQGSLSLTSVKAPVISSSSAKYKFSYMKVKTPKGDVISIIVEIAGLVVQYAVPEIEALIQAFQTTAPTLAQVQALPALCQTPGAY